MAGDDMEFRIIANDDASQVVERVAQKVDKLDGTKAEIELEADGKKAEKEVKSLAERLEGLTERQQEIVLKAEIGNAEADIKRLERSFKDFRSMTDDEVQIRLIALDNATEDLETAQKLRDDLNAKKVEIQVEVDQTGGARQSLGDLDSKLKDVEVQGDQSRSVLANMAGNSAQDLGEVGGVVGTLGVGLGQLAEYATEGNIKLSQLAAVAGPMLALAAAGLAVQYAVENIGKAQEQTDQKTASATQSLLEQLGVLDRIKAAVTDAAGTYESAADAFSSSLITDDGDYQKAIQSLGALGLSAKDLGQTMIDLERNPRAALEKLAMGAGATAEQAKILAAAVNDYEDLDSITDELRNLGVNGFDEVARALEELNDQQQNYDVDTVAKGILDQARAADDATRAMVEQAEATAKAKDENASATDVLSEFLRVQGETKAAAAAAVTAIDDFGASVEETKAKVEAERQAIQENANALLAQAEARMAGVNAARAASDADFALAEARDQMALTLAELPGKEEALKKTLDDGSLSAAEHATALIELNGLYRDAAQDAIAAADAAERKAKEDAAATGTTLSATAALDANNRELIAQATQLNGPSRQALIEHLARVNGLDVSVVSDIITNADPTSLADAESKLADASRSRDATVLADADTSQAKADIDALNGRPVTIKVTPSLGSTIASWFGAGKYAGGYTMPGGVNEYGELGRPEVFQAADGRSYLLSPQGGGRVIPLMGGGEAGGGVTNVYTGGTTPARWARLQRQVARRGFSTRSGVR